MTIEEVFLIYLLVHWAKICFVLIVFLFTFANCENWSVNVGDAGKKVTFNFVEGNHDVVQADTFATCAKSALPNAFSTPVYTGNTAAPSTAVWTLTKSGPLYYYCDVEEHCPKHMMYATINVLEAGAALKAPGVNSVPPPATLKTPTPTNGTAPPNTSYFFCYQNL
ncbi:hypothetical protein C1646_674667 [Rhizophagus diaphanus]|nr:hypothetical protein C1646_674667 [Rhizophagus diaphanus] [Rhizophagus sp. MUCL 43196]